MVITEDMRKEYKRILEKATQLCLSLYQKYDSFDGTKELLTELDFINKCIEENENKSNELSLEFVFWLKLLRTIHLEFIAPEPVK